MRYFQAISPSVISYNNKLGFKLIKIKPKKTKIRTHFNEKEF